MKQIRIDKPCPFAPTNRNQVEGGFFCKSCSKTVRDFREATSEEIERQVTADTCGIFREDQLTHLPQFSLSRRFFFNTLTLLSFLGFNVHPVEAQTKESKYEEVYAPTESTEEQTDKEETILSAEVNKKNRKRRRRSFWRRKVKYSLRGSVRGCPTF